MLRNTDFPPVSQSDDVWRLHLWESLQDQQWHPVLSHLQFYTYHTTQEIIRPCVPAFHSHYTEQQSQCLQACGFIIVLIQCTDFNCYSSLFTLSLKMAFSIRSYIELSMLVSVFPAMLLSLYLWYFVIGAYRFLILRCN